MGYYLVHIVVECPPLGKKVGYGDQRVQLKRVLTITHAIFRRVFQRIPISHEIWRAKDRGYLCSASRVLPTCEAWHCGLKLSGSLPTTSIKYCCILWLIKEWTRLIVLIKWIEIEWPKFEEGLSKLVTNQMFSSKYHTKFGVPKIEVTSVQLQRYTHVWAHVAEKYASAVPKNLGLGVDFRLCRDVDFLTGRPKSVAFTIPVNSWAQCYAY